jgi:F-type H+-transporting ATPase subunit b
MLQQDLGLFLWTLVTFGLLLALLGRFAFKPLRAVLAERERLIRESLDRAQRARDEAEQIRQQGAAQLAEAREAAQRVIDEGRRIGAGLQAEARQEARQEAEALLAQARGEIEREVQRSLDELRGTVANLSVRIAREFVRENVDEVRHRQMVDEFVERVKGQRGKSGPS